MSDNSELNDLVDDGARSNPFKGYVVAIGASAGGLDALERFFQGISDDTGAAFVVVQHLSPDHKSMMGNLLARHTSMQVVTVEHDMRIEANRVHLIPPASLMTASGDVLRLSPKNPRGLTLPIDLFFSSLAREFGNHAIGAILSGTGSDGTRGAVAINDAGGFLVAQEPETAKFDGMPRSVIATGLVDAILPPEEIGPRVIEHIHQKPSLRVRPAVATTEVDRDGAHEEVMHLLQHAGGIDFREYKPATVMRRMERRMQVRQTPDLLNYVRLLRADRGELSTLRRELLIPVTSFFRDPDAFEVVAETAIRTIVADHSGAQPMRVWVPGVATGEEAYTLAILFAEAFERARRWPNFKLFATDVEPQNIEVAGAGVFSEAITAEISPERLERFFIKRGNHFVVKTDIRQSIVFARHNLLEDPPFTRMDLVSCRNLLIYFRPQAQERALRRLQYALAPGGFLFLGPSESIANMHTDFTAVSSKHKLYRILRHVALPLDSGSSSRARQSLTQVLPRTSLRAQGVSTDAAAIEAAQVQLLHDYAPTSLLLNQRHDLLHVFGEVGSFLRIAEGSVSLDLARLLPSSLVAVAKALLFKAARDRAPLRSEPMSVTLPHERVEHIRLVARPVEARQGELHLLLSFEPEAVPEPSLVIAGDADAARLSVGAGRSTIETISLDRETTQRLENLERELAATRESLQATIEELETANEELQATNEELMASNEELQSSNEELQSVNEELYTVNAENQEKIEILNRLNADLDGMAKAASIATVFVDEKLRLTRFTPEATILFKIRDGDLGRPIDDLTNLLQYPEFMPELKRTIERGEMLEQEIRAVNDRSYLLRVLPYAVRAGESRGAVATFVDITSLRDVEQLQAVLDSLPEHVAVLDANGLVKMVNRSWLEFERESGRSNAAETVVGADYLTLCESGFLAKEGHAAEVLAGIKAVLRGESSAFSTEYSAETPDGQRCRRLMRVATVDQPTARAVVSHIDITQWSNEEDA
ncbi:chemotaxis protein CheR [Thiorhodococcus mannitoliphagus]|uniref:Chemotaxis protein CheR n=1 Tax=Thiorhodococcus mannitoliphagus TaxID=329406 RepID=A0A6P1DQ22_9GAMM|nr:chemotaxis protein CheB [Thiorhodococcus mannitoliphagus]NEX19253.1 chemotaxis protein CheR [Thiorhodococcus mannitoliphagus]